MKRLSIIVLTMLIATIANAQQNQDQKACYEKIKTAEEAVGKSNLNKLMLYFDKGQTIGGKFPKCEQVVNVVNETKTRIADKFKNTCLDPAVVADMENSNYRLNYRILSSEFDERAYTARVRKGSEGEMQQLAVTTIERDKFTGCFADDATITVMNDTTHEVKVQSFEDFVNYWNAYQTADKFQTIYVLSSPVEMIPDAAPEYLGSCWARVKGYTVAGLNAGTNEDTYCTVSYDATDGTYGRCMATPDHRFRVEICDKNGNKSCEWKHLKDIDSNTMRFLNDSGKSVTILSIVNNKVEDRHWAWLDDMKVYNLMTETGTYFIGEPNRRALVHNFY